MRKKLVALIMIFFIASCGGAYKLNPEIKDNAIKDGYQAVYSPSGKFWSNGGMVDDRIVFTKSISSGSGSYSEYTAKNWPVIMMPTQYEFIFEGRLIGYSTAELKFYELLMINDNFEAKELPLPHVQEIFKGLEIIPVSSATNNELTIKKLPWQTKSFLILNDTTEYFYRYDFETAVKFDEPFKTLITVDKFETIIFSHFGSRESLFPILKIAVRSKI